MARPRSASPRRSRASTRKSTPSGWSRGGWGLPRNMATGFPIQIVQTPGQVTMIFQAGIRVRRIFTDGRAHSAERAPSYNGDSIGRWEGDTLVIETANFKDGARLDHDGTPHSQVLRAVERIRVVEQGGVLFGKSTLFDGTVITGPSVKNDGATNQLGYF